jgi:hypothetical protein
MRARPSLTALPLGFAALESSQGGGGTASGAQGGGGGYSY